MAAILAMATVSMSASAANGNWGLSFPEDGKPPVIDVKPELLARHNAVYMGDASKKRLYLTFDAGYESGHTPSILDTLKRHEVPAAFFVVGHYIQSSPEIVRRMCDEGHIVGNHTFHHPDMSQITDMARFKSELESLEALYKQATGKDMPRYYRPPQGRFSESNLKMAHEMGCKTVFWSLAYKDWVQDSQPTREYAFSKLIPRTHPGAVVLLHNTSKTNADILDELLAKWKAEGYTFGTIDEL
ncbi:MAG: delta-lactam-biosynthetic de-N-acetylase [Oscillospiraceae bacterium]|nr:delta-lactam-biosynthetic de-N-acetylase [Oscillospiraceae bacterium]